ncbi:MAG: TRAP transporter large permease subunit, partial [Pseudomonadota bacterium]
VLAHRLAGSLHLGEVSDDRLPSLLYIVHVLAVTTVEAPVHEILNICGVIIMGFMLGTLRFSDFPAMLVSSAKVNGVILPIIAFSLPLAQALAIMGVPQGFVAAATSVSNEPWVLILMMVGILIAAGCVMETTPNIVILAPILKPLADNIGMNEIQFCIMMITALGVGFITPPLGLNLFVVSGITGESILKIAYRAIPFVFFMLVVTLFIAYVPAISTTLLPEILK